MPFIRGGIALVVMFGLLIFGPLFVYLKVAGEPMGGGLILLHLVLVYFFGGHVLAWICRIPKVGPFLRQGVFDLNGRG